MLKILTAFFLFAALVQAEDPARGRLPDGRAFRTDVNGNEIIDYIAELELAIEEGNRRVIALENELKARKVNQAPVAEKNLLAEKVVAKPVCTAADCTEACRSSEEKTARLQAELEDVKIDLGIAEKSYQKEKQNLLSQISGLKKEIEGIKTAALTEPAKREVSAEVTDAAGDEDEMRASFIFNPPQDGKKDARRELAAVRDTVQRRNALFAEFKNKSKSISLKPSPAVSAENNSVDSLASRIQGADEEELEQIRLEIAQIHERMVDDMALISRMQNIR